MRRIKGLMNAMEYLDWHEDKGSSDSMSVISLDFKNEKGKVKYSNLIICAPCTEGLLGYDLHKLYLDEFEFWEVDIKHFFNQIAQPRTYTTKGDIIITTNPNGADNFGAELEQQMVRGKRKWHVYVFNFLDRPGNTQIEYDDLKEELDRASFESTVASVRTLSDRNYFSPDEIERSEDKNLKEIDMVGKQPIFFLDVGAKHDQSCLIGGFIELDEDYDEAKSLEDNKRFIHFHVPIIHLYPKGYPLSRVMGVDSPNQESDGWHHEKSVKDHLSEWTIEGVKPYFGYDITGNEGMKPLMDALKIDATDISFSGPSKSAMYQRYKFVMEKGLLHRIKHKEWDSQARTIVVSKSARGYLLINAASQVKKGGRSLDAALKKIPDDTQDATAGFFELADSIHYIPASMVMVGVDD